MIGPPGAGKSLAASRLPSILPPLAAVEALEVARIASACGRLNGSLAGGRPFRAPHHTISPAGLIGGGSPPRPGEATLAHRGVLFLDELCEFRRDALEALRAPLEAGEVSIARASSRRTLPCRFMLVAAANPCPCGRGEADPECSCAPLAVQRYQGRLSGALADRIDILAADAPAERRRDRRRAGRVLGGRAGAGGGGPRAAGAAPRPRPLQRRDDPGRGARVRAQPRGAAALLAELYSRQRLSGRAHDRALRLAQTIADLAGAATIGSEADGAGAAAAEAGSWLSPGPAPTACAAPGCSRCSAPTSSSVATGAPGSRSPELLRLSNEDLVAVAAPKVAAQLLGRVAALPERQPGGGAGGGPVLGLLPPRRSLPRRPARRRRRPLGADRPRRPGAAGQLEPAGSVTIVGARRATSYGREIARELGRELAAAGLVVVSGLAFGIDACAHRGALDAGRTIAVLGCGPDVAYPAAHRSLWRRIGEEGLVLSELPPGAAPWRWTFPARNRIMAALAGMTVVVEAAARSGSLITADLAADLGRDLGAVPGPVTSRASAGPNNLLAGGACLVRDAQDVLDAMLGAGREAARPRRPGPRPGPRRGAGRGRGGGVELRRRSPPPSDLSGPEAAAAPRPPGAARLPHLLDHGPLLAHASPTPGACGYLGCAA